MPNRSPYRVGVYVNIPVKEPRYYDVSDPRTGLILIEAIANEHNQLTELSKRVFGGEIVVSNVFTLQQWDEEEGNYLDWEDNDGSSINEYELNEELQMVPK